MALIRTRIRPQTRSVRLTLSVPASPSLWNWRRAHAFYTLASDRYCCFLTDREIHKGHTSLYAHVISFSYFSLYKTKHFDIFCVQKEKHNINNTNKVIYFSLFSLFSLFIVTFFFQLTVFYLLMYLSFSSSCDLWGTVVHWFLKAAHIENDHEQLLLIIQLRSAGIRSSKQTHLAHVLWPRLPPAHHRCVLP